MFINESSMAPRRNLTVLIVEDEALIALDIEMIVEDHGYGVLGPVSSVDKALKLLESHRPDVGLLDVNLNGETITPVARRLRDLNVPFVLISAYNNVEFLESDALANVENIGKPFNEYGLLSGLHRAVDQSTKR